MLTKDTAIAAIREICKDLPITLAYLHGSYASDRADHESDLDIAVLADPSLSKEKRRKLRMEMHRKLLKRLPTTDLPDLDVVVLQDIPILLQYNIMRRGIPVMERSHGDRVGYTIAVERAYDDEAPYLKRESEIILNRILSHAA